MKICFILPGFISVPMGGIKVVHEYANRLADRGHDITLIYPLQLRTNLIYRFKKTMIRVFDQINGTERALYYTPDTKVTVLTVKKIIGKYVPIGDSVIAVGWQTANAVSNLPENCGNKFYFLQSFESYFINKKQVSKTYHLPLHKIAISQWIINEIEALGEQSAGPLGNAINSNEFFLESKNARRPIDIMFHYHPAKIKGASDVLAVLKTLKKRYPRLTATMITARRPVHRIPAWIEQHFHLTIDKLRQLYNTSKIFLHTSRWEGWGLPVMEAMACGCAIIAYRNRGVSEFMKHQQNGFLTDIGDREQMIKFTEHLLNNPDVITPLTQNAYNTVAKYSWANCVETFEQILKNHETTKNSNGR